MPLPKIDKPATGQKQVSEKRLIAALRAADGIMNHAAEVLGISRQAIKQRIDRSKKLQGIMVQIDEDILDLGEGNIIKALRSGDGQMTRWAMERKGRKRGWGTRVENSFDNAQVEGLLAALGGKPEAYRAALVRLGVDPAEI